MRKLALGSVLVALVGATFAVAGTPASADLAQPTYVEGVTLGEPVRMPYTDPAQVGGPGEPSIKVDDAGTIYVAGVCCVGRASPAWYSRDDGETFEYLPSPGGARETTLGAEGDFIVDDADGVYFVDTWVPNLLYTRWSGHGDVWEYTQDTAIGVIPGVDDRPWLAYSHGAVYLYVNHATHVTVYKSTDGGHTWDTSFDTIGRGQQYFPGHVAADRNSDDVYLFGEGCGLAAICAAVSHDAGETWEEFPAGTLPRGGLAAFMTAADVDAAGNVYGVYADTDGSGCDVYLAASADRGETWTQYRVNPEQGGCATFPWVAAGDDGRIAATWYENPSPKSQNTVPGNSEWHLRAAVITDAASASPTVTYGTMDQVIHKGPLNRDLWDFQQIDVGPDGRFHIAAVEDQTPECSGTLSTQGSLAGYANKCTIYVPQTGGPRAIPHAADATSIHDLRTVATETGVEVSGSVTFGRATPVTAVDDDAGDAAPSLDLRSGTIVRPNATSDGLTFELDVDGLPEVLWGDGGFAWDLRVGEEQYRLFMQPRPRTFQLCHGDDCTPVRGDTDAGGDRIVAEVPLALLGAAPGSLIETTAVGAYGAVVAGPPPGTLDTADPVADYTVPGPTVLVRGLGADGNAIETTGTLSADLSTFTATLTGAVPGMVEVEACFGDACDAATAGP